MQCCSRHASRMATWLAMCFAGYGRSPINMTQGDIAVNVAALAARDSSIRDPIVQRAIVEALTWLQGALASTACVEAGHASGAVIMRDRERYSDNTLRVRALLHSMRALLRPLKVERQVVRIESAPERLAAMQPNRVCGRQMFLRAAVQAKNERAPGVPASRLAIACRA